MNQEITFARRVPVCLALVVVLMGAVTSILASILWEMGDPVVGLGAAVSQNLAASGVASPVTAVLLNFRGYDTMLEVIVLFLAVVGVWSSSRAVFFDRLEDCSPVQISVVRLWGPVMVLTAGYLVWQGGHLAGGAFQGGAVLAGAGVMMLITALPWLQEMPAQLLRFGLGAGPAVFLAVAVLCLGMAKATLLGYPDDKAGGLLLIIEAACAVSIGLTLAGLFGGGRPTDEP